MIEDKDFESALEAVLFVCTDAVTTKHLAEIFEREASEVEETLQGLQKRYEVEDKGIILKQIAGGWRLFSNPKFHEVIEKYVLSLDPRKLSAAALETLSIIAYSQPVTRAGVASVRGVNSDSSINSLIEKGLVKEAGVADTAGSPILYATTNKFLENFGLNSIKDLPNIEDFAPDEETKRFIFERLSATQTDQLDQMEAFESEVGDSSSEEKPELDSKDMFESALAGAFGVTEKVNLDEIKLNTEDE
ncbi:MAG: SMC-Scp complex subunit ScpB [Coriobacteriia bacterium]|nr:SMC-Scp complex subunit ScpB [Coriobacteriia bacterium]